MKKNKAEIIKVHAEGTNFRCCTIKFKDIVFSVRIRHETYVYLKDNGVPTSQALRWQKQKTLKTKEVINSH